MVKYGFFAKWKIEATKEEGNTSIIVFRPLMMAL
jgi:hypothetical protein